MVDAKQIQNHYINIVGSGSRTLSTTLTTAPLNTISASSNTLFSATGGVITYNGPNSKLVEVSYNSSGDAGANTRSTMTSALLINGTSDATTERFSYHRTGADGEGSVSYLGIFSVNNGATFALQNAERTTGDNIVQFLDKSNLQIKLL
jgi:hypothetical protein